MRFGRWHAGALVLAGAGLAAWLLLRGGGAGERTDVELPRGPIVERARLIGVAETGAGLDWLVEPGVAPRRVAGVVRSKGAPVAGARVTLHSYGSGLAAMAPPTVETGADGRFEFGAMPAVQYVGSAMTNDRRNAQVRIDLADPRTAPPPDELVLELRDCPAWFEGYVFDAGGGVIAGARVESSIRHLALASSAATVAPFDAVETDERGAYRLCGEYASGVRVSADGYGTVWLESRAQDGDVYLVPAASIRGRVVDQDGMPVTRATVALRGRLLSERIAVVDGGGGFAFDGVAPGRYELAVDRAAAHERGGKVSVHVGPGEQVDGVVVVAQPCGRRVAGRVLLDGEVVAGAWVHLGSGEAVTQVDGTFVLRCVDRASSPLQVLGYDVVAPAELPQGDESIEDLSITVSRRGSIAGVVVFQGAPVAGATVAIGRADAWVAPVRELFRTTTDGDGVFVLPGVPDGVHALTAFDPDAQRHGGPVEVSVADARAVDSVQIELRAGGAIRGRVAYEDGEPIAGAGVSAARSLEAGPRLGTRSMEPWAVTDDRGAFELTGLPDGDYQVWLEAPHHDVRCEPEGRVTVREGAAVPSVTLTVRRKSSLELTGRVQYEDGSAAVYAYVNAWRDATVTGLDGSFTLAFHGYPEEPRDLRITGPDGSEWTGSAVPGGEPLVVTLQRSGALEIRVTGDGSGWQICARIKAASDPCASAAGGRVMFAGLTPGTYSLEAWSIAGGEERELELGTAAVSPGATTSMTVELDGNAARKGAVVGKAVSYPGGAPVAGAACGFGSEAALMLQEGATIFTDVEGRFRRDEVNEEKVPVTCQTAESDGVQWTGRAFVVVVANSAVEVIVPMVEVDAPTQPAALGVGLANVRHHGDDARAFVEVVSGGVADLAGLRDGDVLVAVAGSPATGVFADAAATAVVLCRPGVLALRVERGGEQVDVALDCPAR